MPLEHISNYFSIFFFSFFLKREYNFLPLIDFLKIFSCLEFFCLFPTAGHFLRAGVIQSPAVLVTIKQQLALGIKLLLWETATRRQHYYVLNSCYQGNRVFLQVVIRGCKIEWNVLGEAPRSLCLLTYVCFLNLISISYRSKFDQSVLIVCCTESAQ